MNEGYRNLMLAVLATQIGDYLNGILSKIGKKYKEETLSTHARKARVWIEDNESVYIFSFVSICKHVGMDPIKMRKRILTIKTPDQALEVLNRKQKMESFGK